MYQPQLPRVTPAIRFAPGTIKVLRVHELRLIAWESAAVREPSAHSVQTTALNTKKANAIEFMSIQGIPSIFGRPDLTHQNDVSALVFYALQPRRSSEVRDREPRCFFSSRGLESFLKTPLFVDRLS